MKKLSTQFPFLERLYYYPTWVKGAIILAVFVFTILIGYLIDSRFQANQLNSIKRTQASLKQSFESQYQEYIRLESRQRENEALEAQLTQHERELLATPAQTGATLDKIAALAKDNKLRVALIKPGKSVNQTFYSELPVRISMLGEYKDIANFLSQLAQLEPLVLIQQWDMVLERKDLYLLTLQMEATIYQQPVPGQPAPEAKPGIKK